ncbi:MAG: outer membrane protein [Planctomycetia bacterium]
MTGLSGPKSDFSWGLPTQSTDTEYRDLDLSDITFGVTKQWEVIPRVTLVVGGGLRIANATLLGPGWLFGTELDDDYSLGYYAHAGFWWMFHKNIGVGLDARHADGSDFRLAGESVDSGGAQLLLGLRWAF